MGDWGLPPAPAGTREGQRSDDGWQTPPGGHAPPVGGGWSPPAPPAQPPPAQPPAGGPSAWPPPPQGQAPPGGPPPRPAARSGRRGAPVWLTVVIALVSLVVGLGIGGLIGFSVGSASGLFEELGDPFATAGPDAEVATAPIDAERIEVGRFVLTDLVVDADFAEDFLAEVTLANAGSAWGGGAIELIFYAGEERLGQVAGTVERLGAGDEIRLELWGFDSYDPRVDRVEVRIG